MSEIIRGIIDGKFVETLCEIALEFLAHFLRRTRITNTKYSCIYQLSLFTTADSVYREQYCRVLSVLFFLYLCFGICLPGLSCQ